MGVCISCGQEYDDETRFCSYCGTEQPEGGATIGQPLPNPSPRATAASTATTRVMHNAPPTHPPSSHVAAQRQGHRWLWVSVAVVAILVVAAFAAVVLVRGSSGETYVTSSPGPAQSPPTNGKVMIVSLRDGDKVTGGQAVRVAVFARGFEEGVTVSLVVNGSAVGNARTSQSSSFLWRPSKAGDTARVQAVVALADGSLVRSHTVTVKVLAKPTPAPEVTVVVTTPPTIGVPDTPFYGAFYKSTHDPAEAEGWAEKGRAAGFATLVLYTGDYASLGKAGSDDWWSVCAGPYPDESSAEAAANYLDSSGFSGAYAKIVQ